jgi:hypothetical protein
MTEQVLLESLKHTLEHASPSEIRSLDWKLLSKHPSIPFSFIEETMDRLPWSTFEMSEHPKLHIRFIEQHKEKYWKWRLLTVHPNISLDDIQNHLDLYWMWGIMSMHPNMTMTFVKKHISREWSYIMLQSEPRIALYHEKELFQMMQECPNRTDKWHPTFFALFAPLVSMKRWIQQHEDEKRTLYKCKTYVQKLLRGSTEKPESPSDYYSMPGFSKNENITYELLCMTDDWDYNCLSENKSLTQRYVDEHPDKAWNWSVLSIHPTVIDMDFVLRHLEKPFDWKQLSRHPNIRLRDIDRNIRLPWSFPDISYNPHVNIDFIIKYYKKSWNFAVLSRHPNVYIHEIERYHWLPWSYEHVAQNPNLSRKDFVKFSTEGKMNIQMLIRNQFEHSDLCKLVRSIQTKRLLRFLIPMQQRFLERYWNPEETLCQERLKRECSELNVEIESAKRQKK